MSSTPYNLEIISEMLARDFIVLEQKGFVQCSLIGLFGADRDILAAMAASMRQYLSDSGRREIAVIVRNSAPFPTDASYDIDAGYFLPSFCGGLDGASHPSFARHTS